jgi:DNA-binding MarR family transcriptional regulator
MARRPNADSESSRQDGEGVPLELVLGGGSLVQQVGRKLHTTVETELASFDVTAQQAALLLHAAQGQTSPNQLAPLLGTDTAGMTRLLDRLEAKRLIRRRRHPQDRRSRVIEVTAEGQTIVPRLSPIFGHVSFRLLDGFSENEVRQLTTMLQRMLDNLHGEGSRGSKERP